jgi:hypothetical protein
VRTGSVANSSRSDRSATNSTPEAQNPIIATVNTRYIVEDSSNVNIYLELTVDNFPLDEMVQKRFATRYRVSWLLVNDYSIRERIKSDKIDLNEESFS